VPTAVEPATTVESTSEMGATESTGMPTAEVATSNATDMDPAGANLRGAEAAGPALEGRMATEVRRLAVSVN
jgi:hypothetical protein